MTAAHTKVVIADDARLAGAKLLEQALELGAFWAVLDAQRERASVDADGFRVVIKTDLNAFEAGSPTATDPSLVELLIDLLHDRGCARVDVCGTADSSFLWAENRDVTALANLLGYAYETPKGRAYDVLDLSEGLSEAPFSEHGVLAGSSLGEGWLRAHFRICFARNKTDEREGYALCLDSLLGVLPLVDKDYHYRARMPAGEAVCELVRFAPVHFALIDATVSAHGSGGRRAPEPIATHSVIASPSPVLADFVGALKMGLDPYASPLAASVYRQLGLPERYTVSGNLAAYAGWRNVHAVLGESRRRRDSLLAADRLLDPMLQRLDAELFPLKHVVNAKVNPGLSRFFGDTDRDHAARWLLIFMNYAVGAAGAWLDAYRVLYDKDSIRRKRVPLGLDLERYDDASYERIRPELDQVGALLAGLTPAADGLRWREVDGATLFQFQRRLPIPFDVFTTHVDVARTIQYMNDYIGGVVVPVARDASGRVVRQAERNLYLPQPNYLVLYQGRCIDVGKIEVCDYEPDLHRMYWKTVQSANGSAVHDDGVVTFEREGGATRVSIVGRQLFNLPPFWQAVDLNLAPAVKSALVTHAYKTFFERTCANFEGLVEGRDIRVGRDWYMPVDCFDSEPLPVERLEQAVMRIAERLQAWTGAEAGDASPTGRVATPAAARVDEDGFCHFAGPPESPTTGTGDGAWNATAAAAGEALGEFLEQLMAAMGRDAAELAERARGWGT